MRPEERDLPDKTFPKTNHLLKSSEFKSVFGKGRKLVTGVLVFHYLRTDLSEPRLGLAVSRKVGNAVKRNHVKRRIREAFREKKAHFHISHDIVVYPRRGVLDKHFDEYVKSFDVLLSRIGRPKKVQPRKV